MPKQVVISDTSVLIALSNIGELEILKMLYMEVIITPEILEEFQQTIPKRIKLESVKDEQKLRLLSLDLDKGEYSCIALALEKKSSLLIIDEKKGRRIA